jgi:hypothetical protein
MAFVLLLSIKFSPDVQPFCKCRHLTVSATLVTYCSRNGVDLGQSCGLLRSPACSKGRSASHIIVY